MPGKRQAKRKASMPRTIGMVIFRILAIGVWIFALLIFVGGLSTDFLTCTIIALIIAFVGWMLWVVGDMIHDPEKIRAEQRAARAAKDPSIVLDEDNEHERKRAANGHWDGRANHGHAQPNDETSPALAGVEVEDGEALASAHRETGQSSTLARTISPSPIIIPPKTLSVSATRETETVSGSYPATIYVYDPRPILKLKEGRAEKISVVTRPITLKSRLNGRQWRSGVDDGYAVEYKGKPFGVLFNHIAVIHIRTILESGAKNVELVAMRQGWYQTGIPEIYVMVPTLEEAKESETGNASLKEYEQRQAYGGPWPPQRPYSASRRITGMVLEFPTKDSSLSRPPSNSCRCRKDRRQSRILHSKAEVLCSQRSRRGRRPHTLRLSHSSAND